MNDRDSNSETSAEEVPREKLGITLQRAREFKGLKTEDVAHRLNLSQQRVYDMENDDYRFAGAETYAKGYLRSYAKLLGLDPDLIVHEFERLKYSDTIERHETKFLSKRQFSSGDRWMRWVTYSIGMILIFLVAIWWRSQPNHVVTTTVATETTDQTSTDVTPQTTQKTETVSNQPAEVQSESIPSTLESTLSQASAQPTTTGTMPQSDKTQTVQTQGTTSDIKNNSATQAPDAANQKNPTISTAAPANPQAPTNRTAIKSSAPASSDSVDDSDEDDDDDTTDAKADNSAVTKKQSWYQIKPFKPRVLIGQRGQDERALLQELEKVFGRG